MRTKRSWFPILSILICLLFLANAVEKSPSPTAPSTSIPELDGESEINQRATNETVSPSPSPSLLSPSPSPFRNVTKSEESKEPDLSILEAQYVFGEDNVVLVGVNKNFNGSIRCIFEFTLLNGTVLPLQYEDGDLEVDGKIRCMAPSLVESADDLSKLESTYVKLEVNAYITNDIMVNPPPTPTPTPTASATPQPDPTSVITATPSSSPSPSPSSRPKKARPTTEAESPPPKEPPKPVKPRPASPHPSTNVLDLSEGKSQGSSIDIVLLLPGVLTVAGLGVWVFLRRRRSVNANRYRRSARDNSGHIPTFLHN